MRALGPIAEVAAVHPRVAFKKQCRGDQKRQGKRDFSGRQNVAQTPLPRSLRSRATARFQCFGEVWFRKLEGRRQAEQQPRRQRHRQGEQKDFRVQSDLIGPRRKGKAQVLGNQCGGETGTPHGEQSSEPASDCGQNQGLDQELRDQGLAARAQRRSDRHLTGAPASADQQQVGKIRANNQHHHAHRGQQQEQGGTSAPHHCVLFAKRPNPHAPARHVSMPIEKPRRKRLHFRLRLAQPHAALQAADRHQRGPAAAVHQIFVGEAEWRPDIHSSPEEPEIRRHDPDDGVRLPAQLNDFAQRVSVAGEAPPPESMA